MKKNLFLGFFLFWGIIAFSQQHIQYVPISSATLDLVQSSSANLNANQVVTVGTIVDAPTNDTDIGVVVTDISGNVLWSRQLTYGTQDEFAGSVIIDDSGNIVLTGYTGANGFATGKDLILVKLNPGGTVITDVVVQDASLGNELYGFDLEQTQAGNYIVVGLATPFANLAVDKYAFAVSVNSNLTGVLWTKQYISAGGSSFNSFTHILKVDSPTYGEAYLLTGSSTSSTTNEQVSNFLIDASGNTLWSKAYEGSTELGTLPGVAALYNENDDEFYVLHHTRFRPSPAVVVLDGSTGTINDFNFFLGDQTFDKIINDMKWADASQHAIIFSGYNIEFAGSGNVDSPLLFSIDFSSSTPVYQWGRIFENSTVSSTAHQSVDFDPIVQPLQVLTPGSYLQQLYYQPKPLVKVDDGAFQGYNYASIQQDNGSTPINLSLIQTDLSGNLGSGTDGNCNLNFNFTNFSDEITSAISPTSTSITFSVIGPGANASPLVVNTYLGCNIGGRGLGLTDPIQENTLLAYPNPVEGVLTIEGTKELSGAMVKLYDLQGRLVQSQTVTQTSQIQITTTNLQSGIYFLKVVATNQDILLQQRIIKK